MAQMHEIMDSMFGDDDSSSEGEHPIDNTTEKHSMTEVFHIENIGGNRGLRAVVDLPAGVLVLAEIPIISWSNANFAEQEDLCRCLSLVLANPAAVDATRSLHPKSHSDADTVEIDAMREKLSEELGTLAQSHGVAEDEIIRTALVLQHNGFNSGLYENLAILNHSCSPNCVKLSPTPASCHASEIWTTRPVVAGEELTICYHGQLEQTKSSMQSFLSQHHRFECSCVRCRLSNVNPHIEANIEGVEDTKADSEPEEKAGLEAIEQDLNHMESELLWQTVDDNAVDVMRTTRDMMKANTIMLRSIEKCRDRDGDSVRILARAHRVGVHASARYIEFGSDEWDQKKAKDAKATKIAPKKSTFREAAVSYLYHSLKLLECQTEYLGEQHPDVASTHQDISQAIECFVGFCDGEEELKHFQEMFVDIELNHMSLRSVKELKKAGKSYADKSKDIQRLYRTRIRFPNAPKVLTHPGACYWGDSVPENS